MTQLQFRHGAYVVEQSAVPAYARAFDTTIIAVIGTAPDADATEFPYNEPVLIKGYADNARAEKLGTTGTLPDALDAIRDQIGAHMHFIRIEEGDTLAETVANAVGDSVALTGVHALKRIEEKYGASLKARLICAPGLTAPQSVSGVSVPKITAGGAGYTDATTLTLSGGGGAGAVLTPIITGGVITSVAIADPGTGYTSEPTVTVADTGGGSGATITVEIGLVGSPVVHELVGILDEITAVAFIDGPSTSDADALKYATRFSSDRLYLIDPQGMVWDSGSDAYVPHPLSAHFAGVQAAAHREVGVQQSVSNRPINGVDRITRPIRYGIHTDTLNGAGVNTVINRGNGWRTWGNRSLSNEFLCVRIAKDVLNEGIEEAVMAYVDRPPSEATLRLLSSTAQGFMNRMVSEGIIIGGEAYFDPNFNSPEENAQGRWTVSINFTPAAPMESIRVLSTETTVHYEYLLERIRSSLTNRGA